MFMFLQQNLIQRVGESQIHSQVQMFKRDNKECKSRNAGPLGFSV
jgi:hypothetical protein